MGLLNRDAVVVILASKFVSLLKLEPLTSSTGTGVRRQLPNPSHPSAVSDAPDPDVSSSQELGRSPRANRRLDRVL